jgi:hypothetical protein
MNRDDRHRFVSTSYTGFFRPEEEASIVNAELKRTANGVIDKIRQLRDSL